MNSDRLYLSKVNTYYECPRKAFWIHHKHISSKEEPFYLTDGANFHKIMATNFQQGYGAAMETLTKLVTNPEGRDLMEEMILATIAELGTNYEIFSVEKALALDISSISDIFKKWYIKADLVFKDKEGLWAGELKTTSSYGTSAARYYHNSPQTLTYYYILQQLIPNLRGTKLIITTKGTKKDGPQCIIEPVLITEKDKKIAQRFIERAVKYTTKIEREGEFPEYPSCISVRGGECVYLPLCIPKASQEYIESTVKDWYKIKNPDEHLELKEEKSG